VDGNVICGGKVGNGGVDNGVNVESHLFFRMCLSYSATLIRVCVRVLVIDILITVLFIDNCCNSPVFCCKSAHCVI
jgi:hypothetical protein